ncbi:hypothetical protein SacmaDRAFT_1878 [Saccharomonospora marina XMU15]|uniref:Uncharacterized protein n=1 Tax=Saccharomonospora marina XMU15 TaxID=882083 RepID=H5X6J6_9PSEU|nr:hypothetical protein [Saccharomonospora marina]EHR50144.1 hypothetical protein SacmaDRAFT_1878 [Saccharomonospora marina XMU15]
MATGKVKCGICGDGSGWLLETVIDAENGLVTSREVPCDACLVHSRPAAGRQIRHHSGIRGRAMSWLRRRVGSRA